MAITREQLSAAVSVADAMPADKTAATKWLLARLTKADDSGHSSPGIQFILDQPRYPAAKLFCGTPGLLDATTYADVAAAIVADTVSGRLDAQCALSSLWFAGFFAADACRMLLSLGLTTAGDQPPPAAAADIDVLPRLERAGWLFEHIVPAMTDVLAWDDRRIMAALLADHPPGWRVRCLATTWDDARIFASIPGDDISVLQLLRDADWSPGKCHDAALAAGWSADRVAAAVQ